VAATDVFRDAWRAAHGTLRRLKAVLPYAQGQSPQRPKLHRLARLFRAGLGTPPADFHAALEAQREALEKLVREGEELLTFLDTNRNALRLLAETLRQAAEPNDRSPRPFASLWKAAIASLVSAGTFCLAPLWGVPCLWVGILAGGLALAFAAQSLWEAAERSSSRWLRGLELLRSYLADQPPSFRIEPSPMPPG
jgi:hypothetical protein